MIDIFAAAKPSIAWQDAKIVEIVPRTRLIKSFYFSLPLPFAYSAGQHVDLRLTAADGYRAMRSYSIASAYEGSDVIELAIERLDDGEVSTFLHDIAVVGDAVELRGPLGGHFVWSVADGGPLLLVGGGSGLVPLMAMLRHLRASPMQVPAALLLSSRTWDDVLYRDELLELERTHPGLSLTMALTRDHPRRATDFDRRIDLEMIGDVTARLPEMARYVFICGSNAFVNVASDAAVDAGIPAARIKTERYGA